MKNHPEKIRLLIIILFAAVAIGYFAFYLLRVIPTTPFGFEISSSNPYAMDAFARSEDGFLFDDPFGDGDGMRGGSSLYMRDCKVKISGVITSGKYRFRVYNENQEKVFEYTLPSGTYSDFWLAIGDLGHSYTVASGISETRFEGSITFDLYTYNRKYERIKDSFAR